MTGVQGGNRNIEILAPAGSYDSFRAAIAAGADAVYAGGPRFGARAFAENFTEKELLEAIDHAHLHGRKFYLTINTLLKDSETEDLKAYLEPLYLGGLDAVIVQDLGVLDVVRTQFPGLCIHASTQMTVTGADGAAFLKEEGVERIVPARELSLDEIRHMKETTGMEIECFVHGALCYCYSGQCLLSSLIGGRSGNRGQCAQPCRLTYSVKGEKAHWLSPKDICTLELIPELVDAGIDSFKIEGRMKRPAYVAGVTGMYRKYTDLYLEKGREGFRVEAADREMLMDLYNRGGFHTGYYQQHNGKDMMSTVRPNHAGVPLMKVTSQKGREVTGTALTDIHKGDVMEFSGEKENYTFGSEYQKGERVMALSPKGCRVLNGAVLYRTRNSQLLSRLEDPGLFGKIQEKIYGFLTLSTGKPAKLVVGTGENFVEVCSTQLVEPAAKSPLSEERLRRQMEKTGNTEFVFEHLDIVLEGEVFLPMQQLNELRRRALEALEEELCKRRHRVRANISPEKAALLPDAEQKPEETSGEHPLQRKTAYLTVLAETKEQLEAVADFVENDMRQDAAGCDGIVRIYADSAMEGDLFACKEALALCRRIRMCGIQVLLALPHIFREPAKRLFTKRYSERILREFDGALVRNLESLQFLRKTGFDRTVILDHNLYVFNRYAKAFWKRQGSDGFTVPAELNRQEICTLGADGGELMIYGYLPVMLSAQCVKKNTSGCTKKDGCTILTDRLQNHFSVRSRCRECYNVIYNASPLYLLDLKDELEKTKADAFRIQFSTENREETKAVLKEYQRIFWEEKEPEVRPDGITRGHFRRGIS